MIIKEIKSVAQYVEYIEGLNNPKQFWYRGVANENYFPVPGTVWKNVNPVIEGALEHHFLVSYKSYIKDNNLSGWDLYALMQHHGLPTRLLDWSESALVALFFALTSEPNSNFNRAVWIIDPYKLNEKTIGIGSLFCPSVIADNVIKISNEEEINLDRYLPPNMKPKGVNRLLPEKPVAINATQHLKRVSAQKGCFTVNGSLNESIDSYLKDTDNCQKIIIVVNSNHARASMIRTLASLGIDEEFIYQDLDSLCSRIKREYNIRL